MSQTITSFFIFSRLLSSFAFRFLFSRRSSSSLIGIGWIVWIGLVLAVAAQIVTMTIFSGFEKQFLTSILGFNADLVVMKESEMTPDEGRLLIEKMTSYRFPEGGISSFTPFLYREGLIVYHSKVKGVVFKGIDSDSFSNVYKIVFHTLDHKKEESLSALFDQNRLTPPIIIGKNLAEFLGVQPNDRILKIFSPTGDLSRPSDLKNFTSFEVVGTFTTGLYEYDSQFVFLPLKQAQQFFGLDQKISGYEMKVSSLRAAKKIAARFQEQLGLPFQFIPWDELNGEVFQAIHLEKFFFFLLMSTIVGIAAVNLVGLMVILISEQAKELFILRGLGFSFQNQIWFLAFQAIFLGGVGVMGGVVVGVLISWLLSRYFYFSLAEEVYLISRLPIDLDLKQIFTVFLFGFGISIIVSRVAAWKILKEGKKSWMKGEGGF